ISLSHRHQVHSLSRWVPREWWASPPHSFLDHLSTAPLSLCHFVEPRFIWLNHFVCQLQESPSDTQSIAYLKNRLDVELVCHLHPFPCQLVSIFGAVHSTALSNAVHCQASASFGCKFDFFTIIACLCYLRIDLFLTFAYSTTRFGVRFLYSINATVVSINSNV